VKRSALVGGLAAQQNDETLDVRWTDCGSASNFWRNMYRILFIPMSALIVAGCQDPICVSPPRDNGLLITFEVRPPDGTVLRFQTASDPLPGTYECGTEVDCGAGLYFPDFLPDRIEAFGETPDGGMVAGSGMPVYELFEGCGDQTYTFGNVRLTLTPSGSDI
jgi:hypothetical protein